MNASLERMNLMAPTQLDWIHVMYTCMSWRSSRSINQLRPTAGWSRHLD